VKELEDKLLLSETKVTHSDKLLQRWDCQNINATREKTISETTVARQYSAFVCVCLFVSTITRKIYNVLIRNFVGLMVIG
jgi:hypothetical protein